MSVVVSTPVKDGFYMPAEWSQHERCWIIWPHNPVTYPHQACRAQQAVTAFVNKLVEYEAVHLCVLPSLIQEAESVVNPKVTLIPLDSLDSWMRDVGPTFLISRLTTELRAVDWRFNNYGGHTDPSEPHPDELIASTILALYEIKRYVCDLIMEGGAIHIDGEGSCITTKQCLLHHNRNLSSIPTPRTESLIEETLYEYLGVSKVIWLESGLYGDHDTDGHIDNIACFSSPGHVVLAWTDDEKDPQYEISFHAYNILSHTTDAQGRSLTIHKLHIPSPMYMTEEDLTEADLSSHSKLQENRVIGARIPASYVNFYIANKAVFVPGFNDSKYDREAVNVLQALFPSREIVQITSRDILLGGGNLHCITQQQPKINKPSI